MIRLFFRFLGVLLLAAAFAALIVDGTKSIAANSVIYTPAADTAAQVFPEKLKSLQPALEHIHPLLWNPGMTSLLRLPIWIIIAVLGIICLLLGRKPRPKIGYSRR
jgi:UDP-N-acetylmuramyl pentapeptide phosphotransferase/UDP-N-acetylglucosamine-1-phosphate transferase